MNKDMMMRPRVFAAVRIGRTGLLALGVAAALAAPGAGQALPRQPATHVVDLAGVVDAGREQQLDRFLTELEQKTTAQVIVLTIKSTEGVPIEDFAVETFKKWKLGVAGKHNGVLVAIAVNDRRAKIEVGYGLEPVLTDVTTGRIAREVFTPHFRRGDFGSGIYEGTVLLANLVAAEAGVQIGGMPQRSFDDAAPGPAPSQRGGRSQSPGAICLAVGLVLFVLLIAGGTRRRRAGYGYRRHRGSGLGNALLWMLIGQALGGGRRGHWGGGGGSFGGFGGRGFGGGGFGGGRGGASGGGGASFGW